MKNSNLYISNIEQNTQLVNKNKQKLKLFIFARFVCFIIISILLYEFFNTNFSVIYLLFSTIAIVLFAIIANFDTKLVYKTKITELIRDINIFEIDLINNKNTVASPGDCYIDKLHQFSYDLDIFGEKSLFQTINRTTVHEATNKLADWLSNPLLSKNEIQKRQNAVNELYTMVEWRQKFQALGKEQELENKLFPKNILKNINFNFNPIFIKFIYIFPASAFICYVLAYLSVIDYITPISISIFQLLLCSYYAVKINKSEIKLNGLAKQLNCYLIIAKHINSQNFKSEYLITLKNKLFTENYNILEAFKELNSILNAFDQRKNLLWFILSNSLLMSDLHVLHRFEKWQKKYNSQIIFWIDIISEIDALNSISNFYFNNSDFVFPQFSTHKLLQTSNLGHPLISSERRVCNDFEISDLHQYFIVTGANMAGKSTFLRTVGVNLVLAQIGAPVCASTFVFSPLKLFTSMRTTDNLSENTSYFHAELLRLNQLVSMVQNNNKSLIILDEIMKGTNSKDKFLGSKLFLEKLITYNVSGVIATHDLDLGILEQEHPDNFINICFEIELSEEDMKFDYKINKGITKNLNATYLLKKMKLI